MSIRSFTPRETVGELDRYIVGQSKAKRAVAVALRNRWRRQNVAPELRDEIAPKNILMIGPTGVGKTEIARRLAKLARAPFVKVEASKFTEVGYVGRDVESMIRDLVENAVQIVQAEETLAVAQRAQEAAEERLCRILALADMPPPEPPKQAPQSFGPFTFQGPPPPPPEPPASAVAALKEKLRAGELDERVVELDLEANTTPFMTVFGQNGPEEMGLNLKDLMQQMPGFKERTRRRKLKVGEALPLLVDQEAKRLVDPDRVNREAIERTEQAGIVFLDEIDKIASRSGGHGGGPDISREGVQRDLLPVVEGSTVSTKYGPVKTDHILFIAAGAFHVAKVADLIPELQGRFPIRVELESLASQDFRRILVEPKNALTKQYAALMATEGLELSFDDGAIDAIAEYAEEANRRSENIGARRLHTIMEALLEELGFSAPEREAGEKVVIDADTVRKTLAPIMANDELSRYVL